VAEELARLFDWYAERYMAGDARAVAEIYGAPFIAVRNGSASYLPDRDAVLEHLSGVMAAYQRSGAAHADVASLALLEQGDRAVLATVNWQVRAADGALIRDFQTSYQLVGPDPWRIISYVNHDTVGPG
jgi:hypothetical protein